MKSKAQVKTIGLIGGMGWESSKLYYERLNKKIGEVLGGSHSAKIIMVSVNFAEIEKLTFDNDWKAIGNIVMRCALQLEKAGADMIVLCTNLIHLVSDFITENTVIPFIHIADATGEAIQKNKLQKILLLGTRFTMEKEFYTNILTQKYKLEVVIPKEEERQIIHRIIYDELLKGVFYNKSKETLIHIIECIEGIEGVILGCTELPMILSESDIKLPVFDTGQIHVNKAIEKAIN